MYWLAQPVDTRPTRPPLTQRGCFSVPMPWDELEWLLDEDEKSSKKNRWNCLSEGEMLEEANRRCAFPGDYPDEAEDDDDDAATSVPNVALHEMMQAMTSLHQELAVVKSEAVQRRTEVERLKSDLAVAQNGGRAAVLSKTDSQASSTIASPLLSPSLAGLA
jgi:hypothetical protein